jgi:hypothetical protein
MPYRKRMMPGMMAKTSSHETKERSQKKIVLYRLIKFVADISLYINHREQGHLQMFKGITTVKKVVPVRSLRQEVFSG